MRIVEEIVDANRRAGEADAEAGANLASRIGDLPLVLLTCLDPRLNTMVPKALGLRPEQYIWIRNAANVVADPMDSAARSLALACVLLGGREILVIGHTDCRAAKAGVLQLLERFAAIGVNRHQLPADLPGFFNICANIEQNVRRSVEQLRSSPLLGSAIVVHGLLMDVETGRLKWVLNGYEAPAPVKNQSSELKIQGQEILSSIKQFAENKISNIEFPQTKWGDLAREAQELLKANKNEAPKANPPEAIPPAPEVKPPPVHEARPIRGIQVRKRT